MTQIYHLLSSSSLRFWYSWEFTLPGGERLDGSPKPSRVERPDTEYGVSYGEVELVVLSDTVRPYSLTDANRCSVIVKVGFATID
jgi:hypothetical protein